MKPLTVLLPTDVFPPRCGGAGWSAHALATALISRGHAVTALVPQRHKPPGITAEEVLGVPTRRRYYQAPSIPFVLNYARHERLWPVLAADLVELAQDSIPQATIIHAQHVQVMPAAVLAGQRLGVPVVVTVRDHWPWDYFATGFSDDRLPDPRQSITALARDLLQRLGPGRGLPALLALPYIHAHMQRRQAFLRRANAVIAVSEYMARRLRVLLPPECVHVLPNMVDLAAIEQTIAQPAHIPGLPEQFLLFVGKLEHNKGAALLPQVLQAFRKAWPTDRPLPGLVVAGDGPFKQQIAQQLTVDRYPFQMLDWAEHDQVLRLMAHCTALLYPSAWGEPLSRVLLEACACGTPVVAMPTGGTPDIIRHGVNGMHANTPDEMGRYAALISQQPELRSRMAMEARLIAATFAVPRVIAQVEALYEKLLAQA